MNNIKYIINLLRPIERSTGLYKADGGISRMREFKYGIGVLSNAVNPVFNVSGMGAFYNKPNNNVRYASENNDMTRSNKVMPDKMINDVLSSFNAVINECGFNGVGTLEFISNTLEYVKSENKEVFTIYDLLLSLASERLERDIELVLIDMHTHIESTFGTLSFIGRDKLVTSIRGFLSKNNIPFFNERDFVVIAKNYDLNSFDSNRDVYPLIKENVIARMVLLPYQNVLIDFMRPYDSISSSENGTKSSSKIGARNKGLHARIIGIVEATLREYPNATTYALTRDIRKLLEKEKDKVSIQTLRRWIEKYREDTGTNPDGKSSGVMRLVLP